MLEELEQRGKFNRTNLGSGVGDRLGSVVGPGLGCRLSKERWRRC